MIYGIKNEVRKKAYKEKINSHKVDFFDFISENNLKFKIYYGEFILLSFFHEDMGYSREYKFINPKANDDLWMSNYFIKALNQANTFLDELMHLY